MRTEFKWCLRIREYVCNDKNLSSLDLTSLLICLFDGSLNKSHAGPENHSHSAAAISIGGSSIMASLAASATAAPPAAAASAAALTLSDHSLTVAKVASVKSASSTRVAPSSSLHSVILANCLWKTMALSPAGLRTLPLNLKTTFFLPDGASPAQPTAVSLESQATTVPGKTRALVSLAAKASFNSATSSSVHQAQPQDSESAFSPASTKAS